VIASIAVAPFALTAGTTMRLVECDGVELLEAAEGLQLEGIVSKRRTAPFRSGDCRDWVKVKMVHWRAANRERWRMFNKA
jgi:ATP-dependent DNA ligase